MKLMTIFYMVLALILLVGCARKVKIDAAPNVVDKRALIGPILRELVTADNPYFHAPWNVVITDTE